MSKHLGLTDQDEVGIVEVDEVDEAEDIPAEALDIPGEGGVGDDMVSVCMVNY